MLFVGYKKTQSALSFHHLDPSKKDFIISKFLITRKIWNKLSDELRKSVLLCNNCHGEVHNGITIVPENYVKFNEYYANYDNFLAESKVLTQCIVCNKIKVPYRKTCSKECGYITLTKEFLNSYPESQTL